MTQEKFEFLVKQIMLTIELLGIVAAGVIIIVKYFKTLEVKYTEKSVGATKIKELKDDANAFRADIEHLKGMDKQHEAELDGLETKYDRLIDKFLLYLGQK